MASLPAARACACSRRATNSAVVSTLHGVHQAAPDHAQPYQQRQRQRRRRLTSVSLHGSKHLCWASRSSAPSRQHLARTSAAAGEDGIATGSGGSVPTAQLSSVPQWDAFGIPDAAMAKQLGLNEGLLQSLMELPGTKDMADLKTRLVALSQWNTSLRKGVLPKASGLEWPQEPFRSKFLDVLKGLEMARFTRRHPKLLPPLLKQFLELVAEFEEQLLEQEAKQKQKQQQKQQQQKSPSSGQDPQQQQQQEQQQEEGQGEGGGEQEQSPDDANSQSSSQQKADGEGKEGEQQDFDVDLEESEGSQGDKQKDPSDQQGSAKTEELVKELLDGFKQQWEPMMENMDIAEQAFDDIDGLLEGPEGFDSSTSVWHQTGWREVAALRKKLEDLRELRELVRQLGRGGGKGPLKKAPEQVYNSKHPPGVIRSPLQPEETRGLTRSGDLSRMLPFEAHLLAAGWPRYADAEPSSSDGNGEGGGDGNGGGSGERVVTREGSRGARMLFQARRAERMLMSYEREGWVEDEPARLTGRLEVRPAAELGPIIVCLDTSGSMYGAREVVAKAVALECMRGAHRQQRRCYLYAFSGPGEVMELELGTDEASFKNLLLFLNSGFGGGTDVDAPLERSLERVGREEWSLADILMVTDGEIPQPSERILQALEAARGSLGLEVHGLLVGRSVTPPMEALCTHLHVFKSWSVVAPGSAQPQ